MPKQPNTAAPHQPASARQQQIERIQLAIADGSYEVDALKVSQAIVRKSIVP